MRKKLVLLAVFIVSLCGCGDFGAAGIENIMSETEERSAEESDIEESTEEDIVENDDWRIMEGMQYLPDFAEEEGYFCMGLIGSEERGKIQAPGIEMGESNELNLVVECIVKDMDRRKMAFLVLVDYKQAPLIVDGKKCDTYYIEAEDNVSISKTILLDMDIDRSVDHKITALLINDLQVHASESEHRIVENTAAFDAFLFWNGKKDKLIRQQTEYEIPIGEYEEEFPTLFLTQDDSGNRQGIPQNLIHAKPGETIPLYYHVGGFIESDEMVLFVSVGEKQTKINGKDYLLLHADSPTKVLYGRLELTAPMEEGKYEISAAAVNNPYGEIEMRMQDLYKAPRITLSVEK